MRSRALRILLVILSISSIAASAVYIRSLEMSLSERRELLREVDRLAREASEDLADARLAQPAYVAMGQGADFWMKKVDTAAERVTATLTKLQSSIAAGAARARVSQALGAVAEFTSVDNRIRGYLEADSALMAADVVFGEGGEPAATARQYIEQGRLEEHMELDRLEAETRKLEMAAAGGAAGLIVLISAILALAPARRAAAVEGRAVSLNLTGHVQSPSRAVQSPDDDLILHGKQPVHTQTQGGQSSPAAVPAPPAVALQSVAQLCTDLGRTTEPAALTDLLARAAGILDASGLVLWVGSDSGMELRPVLAHGYAPEVVSRIPVVPRAANNAAAAAYRTGTLQVVASEPGSRAKGAIVAPVLSGDGCVGVLSVEIRDGGEGSASVQSLAAIFAAQLAGIVASTVDVSDQRARGSA
jgi:hypothetical protein